MFENLIYPEYAGRGLTLVSDDNKEIHSQVLVVFRTDEQKEQRYIALLQVIDDEVSNDLMIYRFFEEECAPQLEPISSDAEYTEVANFLGEYLDELERNHNHEDGCGCGCHHDHDNHDDGCGCGGCGCH